MNCTNVIKTWKDIGVMFISCHLFLFLLWALAATANIGCFTAVNTAGAAFVFSVWWANVFWSLFCLKLP